MDDGQSSFFEFLCLGLFFKLSPIIIYIIPAFLVGRDKIDKRVITIQ